MKLWTSLRSGSVKWASPFVIALTLLYYFAGQSASPASYLGYAVTLVADPLRTLYSLAYATAASLAAWESGRIRKSGVWDLAPARSRFRVAANVLLPVLLLAWSVIALPAALALARAGVLPSAGSLRLPLMAALLCVFHAVIGFSVGLYVSPIFGAPITAVVIWVLVAFSRAVLPYWIRHVSGQYGPLSFGELPAYESIAPPLLLAGGLAAGLAMLWSPLKPVLARSIAACVLMVGGPLSAYGMTANWPHTPPLVVGAAPMACSGQAPRVCMPEATSRNLVAVRQESVKVLNDLAAKRAVNIPALVSDQLVNGRLQKASTGQVWYLNLTYADQRRDVAYQVMQAAVRFPCTGVDPVKGRAVMLWAATVTDQQDAYKKRDNQLSRTPEAHSAQRKASAIVSDVLTKPDAEQGQWFRSGLTDACNLDVT